MELISINVATPQTIKIDGKDIQTSIFKTSVNAPVFVGSENIDGDLQADTVNHGGPDMAVYGYGLNHYPYWQQWLEHNQALNYGAMGENLSFSELDETRLCIGDEVTIGAVVLGVSQFRVPCFKLGAKFGRSEMPRAFTQYAHTGAYFKVLQTGTIQAGDAMRISHKNSHSVALKPLFEACFKPKTHGNNALLERAVKVDMLSSEWRKKIISRLNRQ